MSAEAGKSKGDLDGLDPRSQRKALQILSGAKSAFLELGFGGASVDQIARRAGVSKGTLYSYFEDKHALFAAVVSREALAMRVRITEVVSSDGAPGSDLRRLVRNLVEFVISPEPQELYRIVAAESVRFPELGRLFYGSGVSLGIQLISAYFECAHQRGELRVPDPTEAARVMTDLCKGDLFQRSILGVDPEPTSEDLDNEVEAILTVLLKLYGPPRQ